jgi:hypothetical protein
MGSQAKWAENSNFGVFYTKIAKLKTSKNKNAIFGWDKSNLFNIFIYIAPYKEDNFIKS